MREKVLSVLKNILPTIDFLSSDKLVDDKIIDSLSLMTIVSELSVEFDIKISMSELIPENFNSIDLITSLVESKLK